MFKLMAFYIFISLFINTKFKNFLDDKIHNQDITFCEHDGRCCGLR